MSVYKLEKSIDMVASLPIMDGNRIVGVITTTKSGLVAYECKVLIDTTGDGDIIRGAGVPYTAGENYFTYSAKCVTLEGCERALKSGDIANMYSGLAGGGVNLYGKGQPDDVPLWSGLSADEVSEYLIMNQKLLLSKLKAEDRSTRDIVMLPGMPQFRTTCHITGEHIFSENDAYRHFDNSIAAINDFDRRDFLYEIPYGTLYSKCCPNLLTAGRSASAVG